MSVYRCRDFIVSEDGLVFSVVSYAHPEDRVVAFLRFVPEGGRLVKAGTTAGSFRYLEKEHPDYVFFSEVHDAKLQGVPEERIRELIRPDVFLKDLFGGRKLDGHEERIRDLAATLSGRSGVSLDLFGVTGSVLVGAHSPASDVDLVVYGRDGFERVRRIVSECKLPIVPLGEDDFRAAYEKRFPVSKELSFEEFVFHERRKFNCGVFEGVKFDVLYVRGVGEAFGSWGDVAYERIGEVSFNGRVVDDSLAFDYPAVYGVEGDCVFDGRKYTVSEISSFTHTYAGQVFNGERVEASGILEDASSPAGVSYRVLVGSSREASGEYIKNAG
ncbi:MAG: nucleotidyltransferase domain-containing protein [Candidatus Altiarchaeota archaeon]